MGFIEFVICVYFFMSVADIYNFIFRNEMKMYDLMSNSFQYKLSKYSMVISSIASILIPIYGFIFMLWWKALLGLVIGVMIASFNRKILSDIYLSLFGILFTLLGIITFIFHLNYLKN